MADPVQIIDQAYSYAGRSAEQAQSAADAAKNAILGLPDVLLSSVPINLPAYSPDELPARPTFQKVELQLPEEPPAPEGLIALDRLEIDVSQIPADTATLGPLLTPNAPRAITVENLAAPDVKFDFDFPMAPPQMDAVIEAPHLVDRAEPDAPTFVMPSFDASGPGSFNEKPEDYSARLMANFDRMSPQLKNQIIGDRDAMIARFCPDFDAQNDRFQRKVAKMIDGGTAISKPTIDAIYEQNKEKSDAEYRRQVSAARSTAAKLGHTMMPGFVATALQRARQDAADNNARASRETTIKFYELEQAAALQGLQLSQASSQFILGQSLAYVNSLVTINAQALDHSRAVMSAMVESYNAAVGSFQLRLEAYKTEANIFETRMRQVDLAIAIYQAKIGALESLTNVDKAKVDLYRGRIEGIRAYADIYKTRTDIVVSQAQLEKLKLESFGARLDAEKLRVSINALEFDAFKSALQANETTVRVYEAQIGANNAKLNAFGKVADIKSDVIRSQAMVNQEKLAQFGQMLGAYKIKTEVAGDKARLELDVNRQDVVLYQAELQAALAKNQARESYHKLLADTLLTESNQKMQMQFKQADLFVGKARDTASLSNSLANTYANAAQGALNGVNALTTLGA